MVNIYTLHVCRKGHYCTGLQLELGPMPSVTCPECIANGRKDIEMTQLEGVPQEFPVRVDFTFRKSGEHEMVRAEHLEWANAGGLFCYKGSNVPDRNLKPSYSKLPETLFRYRHPATVAGNVDIIAFLARGGCFDDFKFEAHIPEQLDWMGPKVALVELLGKAKLPEVAKMVIDGDFDDRADAEDDAALERDFPGFFDILKKGDGHEEH